jgi:hypothetical protein
VVGHRGLLSIYHLSVAFSNAKSWFVKYNLTDEDIQDIEW